MALTFAVLIDNYGSKKATCCSRCEKDSSEGFHMS